MNGWVAVVMKYNNSSTIITIIRIVCKNFSEVLGSIMKCSIYAKIFISINA